MPESLPQPAAPTTAPASASAAPADNIGPQSLMKDVLAAYPGAQRALFRRYHIGGCSSCAFSQDETVEALCRRNQNLDPAEVLQHLRTSHQEDGKVLLEPAELASWKKDGKPFSLVDVRTREEWSATHLEGSVLLAQPVLQEILGKWHRDSVIVIYDHQGRQSLDAAAFFLGHGFQNVRCLRGGIDAWALEVDPAIPRYRLER